MTSEEFRKGFSKILADRMESFEISQKELSKRSGITQPDISLLLKGRIQPKALTVVLLTDSLAMKPSDLIDFASKSSKHRRS